MANPFSKAWKYLMALFSSKVDEYADPKVQIQQAIEEAQRQHAALSQQAAAVIGNQRQLEMKLTRQMGDVERLSSSARQALVLADEQRAKGNAAEADKYEQTAQAFATQLVAAEQQMEDLKAMHDQALQAAQQAKKAVENNAMQLQTKLAERTKLLSQLEQAKMQEQVSASLQSMSQLQAPGNTPVAGRGPGQDRAPLRQRPRVGRTAHRFDRGPDARGAEVDAGHGRFGPARPAAGAAAPGAGRPAAAVHRFGHRHRRCRSTAAAQPRRCPTSRPDPAVDGSSGTSHDVRPSVRGDCTTSAAVAHGVELATMVSATAGRGDAHPPGPGCRRREEGAGGTSPGDAPGPPARSSAARWPPPAPPWWSRMGVEAGAVGAMVLLRRAVHLVRGRHRAGGVGPAGPQAGGRRAAGRSAGATGRRRRRSGRRWRGWTATPTVCGSWSG